jgi:hypothetical protein
MVRIEARLADFLQLLQEAVVGVRGSILTGAEHIEAILFTHALTATPPGCPELYNTPSGENLRNSG